MNIDKYTKKIKEIEKRIENIYDIIDDRKLMKSRLISLRKEKPFARYHDIEKSLERLINDLEIERDELQYQIDIAADSD